MSAASIDSILYRRTVLSTFLVHFTRDLAEDAPARSNLMSILTAETIEARNSFGMASNLPTSAPQPVRQSQDVVSFPETPLEHAWSLCGPIEKRRCELKPYGLAFTKAWSRLHGASSNGEDSRPDTTSTPPSTAPPSSSTPSSPGPGNCQTTGAPDCPGGLFDRVSARHRSESARLGSMQRMAIKLENVGIAVRDLEATISFFTDLGLTVVGRDTVSGEWTDTAVGLDGNHANIAMLQTPDGHGRLELFEYIHPKAIESKPTRPNEIGMHRVAFSVDDIDKALEVAARHGYRPLRGVATYEDVYKLTYVRGPSGILVMLAEELKKS